MTRGLEEAFVPRRLDIIANGPSAIDAPWDSRTPKLALNGALGLCLDHDCPPHFWAACDPQPLVADFLTRLPPTTTYLPASKCHPSVFDRLQGQRTRRWHVTDHPLPPNVWGVDTASTITLMAAQFAPRMGFWDLHFYGWDCCVLDGQHHASRVGALSGDHRELQFRPAEDGPVLASFATTDGLVYEAQQAVEIVIPLLRRFGVRVTVHGPGLVAHYLNFNPSGETAP